MWRASPPVLTIRLWRGNATAIRNARQACFVLEQSRRERQDVEAFLVDRRERVEVPLGT